MALGFTPTSQVAPEGMGRSVRGLLTFDSSYPGPGGEPYLPSLFGLSGVESIAFKESVSGLVFEHDKSNKKIKALTGGAGSIANESSHTHAVALDTGTSAAGSAHGHAVGTLANAASNTTPRYQPFHAATKPVIALTHNADPVGGLSANPLFLVEAYGIASANVGALQSNCNGAASVSGSTADGTVHGTAATPRFYVTHAGSPAGVQIYVNEASSDRLEFVSPTSQDAYLILPFESIANVPPGFAVAVKVYHSASAATGKALHFDDNGAADAQLIFNDAGTTGGVIPAGDITVIGPVYAGLTAGENGQAAAQAISGSVANESAHTHGPGTLADAASGAGSAHTHSYTGTAGAEVANGTNLSTVAVEVTVYGV